jgi:hypothetical protein
MNYDEITEITAGIVRTGSYQPGDVFQEMYHYWMYVVKVNEDKVVMLEGSPGEFPFSSFIIQIYNLFFNLFYIIIKLIFAI